VSGKPTRLSCAGYETLLRAPIAAKTLCLDLARVKHHYHCAFLLRDVLMAYVPGHEAAVFVSYSHADNFGWIELSLNVVILLIR
jgi:hypothetical protein